MLDSVTLEEVVGVHVRVMQQYLLHPPMGQHMLPILAGPGAGNAGVCVGGGEGRGGGHAGLCGGRGQVQVGVMQEVYVYVEGVDAGASLAQASTLCVAEGGSAGACLHLGGRCGGLPAPGLPPSPGLPTPAADLATQWASAHAC